MLFLICYFSRPSQKGLFGKESQLDTFIFENHIILVLKILNPQLKSQDSMYNFSLRKL